VKAGAPVGRYARALFDVAVKEADVQQVEREFSSFVELVDANPDLGRILRNRVVPTPKKAAAVREILDRLGVSPVVSKLVLFLADRDALDILPAVLERYRRRVMDHLGIVSAELTTAEPLVDDRTAAIRQRLAEVTGKDVRMTTQVQPAIVGGLVARVGSTVYDGSIARQLELVRQKLLEGRASAATIG
jgi:F-type H+-transporting ATPase subunit delta